MNRYILALVVFLASCTTNTTIAQLKLSQTPQINSVLKPANDSRDYGYLTLSNGIRTIVVSDPELDEFSVNLRLGEGSINDPTDQRGFAHLFEHLFFGGTVRYSFLNYFENARRVRFLGADKEDTTVAKTFSTSTELGFHVTQDKIEKALPMFQKMLQGDFTVKETKRGIRSLNRHRVVKAKEFKKMFFADANPLHPISFFEGDPTNYVAKSDSLEDAKVIRQQLLHHYNTRFSANNITLAIVGSESLDKLAGYAETYFSFIPNLQVTAKKITVEAYPKDNLPRTLYIEPTSYLKNLSNRLIVQFFIPNNLTDWQTNPNEYIAWLLTNDNASSLNSWLLESNYISRLYIDNTPDQFATSGYLSVEMALTETGENNRQQIIDMVYRHLGNLQQSALNEKAYLEYIDDSNKKFEQLEMQDAKTLAGKLSDNLFVYPAEFALKAEYTALKYDPAAIQQVLNCLKKDNSRVIQFKQRDNMQTNPQLAFRYKVERE
ncbi:insulinase family protein [Catenovulum agarivorans]|uniref:insulinase family protein n=1 Tax=Catenovulum agarivorans TaxID=1172192 RepID=UPI0002DBF6DC|nr:insulinase family protein [Catenovulum agarivorans]